MNRNVNFAINGRDYILSIPTNGQLIQLESLKVSLSRGQYYSLMQARTVPSMLALESIDMISTLTILCPDLIKDLKVDSLADLDVLDSKKITTIYRETIAPWILEWQTILSQVPTKDDVVDEQQS